jgi:hypothetical protein
LAVGVRLALPLEATMFRLMKTVYCASIFSGCAALGFSEARQGANAHRMRPPFFDFLS